MLIAKRVIIIIVVLFMSANVSAADIGHAIITDIPEELSLDKSGRAPGYALTEEQKAELAAYKFDGDTLKVLAVLVDWTDRPATYPAAVFDSMLFSDGVYPPGSMFDFYKENSYGQMIIDGDIYGWHNAGNYSSFNKYDFGDILDDIDPFVDFSNYDGNNDGLVDAIIFVRSGNGEEDSQNPNDIWSFALTYYDGYELGPFDGMYVKKWNTSPETFPQRNDFFPVTFSGVDTLNSIRVFCHELGHSVGLPDTYDYDEKLNQNTYFTPNDDNDHPMYDWCIMGYYGYGYFSLGSEIPSHFSGWCKKEMGWNEPLELRGEYTDLVLYNIETRQDSSLYMVPIDENNREYFLLEYRNPNSTAKFDKKDSDFSALFWPDLTYGCDKLDRGLLITHIDDSVSLSWPRNEGTPEFPHYTVMVEDAGYHPIFDAYSNPEGYVTDSAQWWYPWETRKGALFSDDVPNQNLFGPATIPGSAGYNGPSGIIVQVDSIVDDRLYLYVYNPNTVTCCEDFRGNVDGLGVITIDDVVYLVEYAFGFPPGPNPPCEDAPAVFPEADVDGNGIIDVDDVVYLVDYAFGFPSGPQPPDCP